MLRKKLHKSMKNGWIPLVLPPIDQYWVDLQGYVVFGGFYNLSVRSERHQGIRDKHYTILKASKQDDTSIWIEYKS